MSLKSKPYHFLLLFAVLLAIISLAGTNSKININIGDTYYVPDIVFMIRAIAMFLVLLWVLYRFTFPFLFSRMLAWLHIIVSITIAVAISAVLLWDAKTYVPEAPIDMAYANIRRAAFMVQLCTISIMFTQLLYFINLFAGILKRVN